MRRSLRLAAWLPPLLLLAVAILLLRPADAPSGEQVTAQTGPFRQFLPLLGEIVAARPTTLRSELDGLSKLVWIVEDGTPVEPGDLLARFDDARFEEQRLTAARDLRLARAELRALVHAKQPLELADLQRERERMTSDLERERALLEQTRPLVDSQLLAPEELTQQQAVLDDLEAAREALSRRLRLTREVLHPAAEEQARARLEAAEQDLQRIERLLDHTEIHAPIRGIVHLPRIRIDGEKRVARVGDGLFKNQVLLELADLTDLVVRTEVDEQYLSDLLPGLDAEIRPTAYPDQTHRGQVRHIATRPVDGGTRYEVSIAFEDAVRDLRPGLTAEVRVEIHTLENVLQIPREALQVKQGRTVVRPAEAPHETRPVQTGPANATHVVVTEGLQPGDRLWIP